MHRVATISIIIYVESNELQLIRSLGNWFQIGIVFAINENFKGFFLVDIFKVVRMSSDSCRR